MFAPAEKRPLLFALYAFNHEIARAPEAAREPMMAAIRLQWWREAVEEARAGRPRAQPAAIGLAQLFAHVSFAPGTFEALIDAREVETSPAPFADFAALELHTQATSAALMRIAATLLNAEADVNSLTREAGTAYGLAGILRSIPFHAGRGRTFLPATLLAASGLTTADALSGRHMRGRAVVISQIADAAVAHFAQARRMALPKHVMPAVLASSLVPAYLRHATRSGGDLRSAGDISQFRRQLVLLRAAMFGKL